MNEVIVLGYFAENYQFLVQDEMSKVTIGVKNTAYYTHWYMLLTAMEISNTILFVSSQMLTTTIQILLIKTSNNPCRLP